MTTSNRELSTNNSSNITPGADGVIAPGVAHPPSPVTTAEEEELTPLTAATFQSGPVENWPHLEGGGILASPPPPAAASNVGGGGAADAPPPPSSRPSLLRRIFRGTLEFYEKFDFPIHVLAAILLAFLYPPLGAIYVAPYITANWVAVCYIFVLFGLGVKTEEFKSALTKMRFNVLIQLYNFGFVSAVVFGVTRLLALSGILTQTLADGLAMCACLPMSINVGIILTMAAGGDEAVAIFHTSFGNFVGVFLSPALILGYLGTIGYIDIGQVYTKLSLIVIVPLIVGQLVQRLVPPVAEFYFAHKKVFKKTAEWALVFIIFTIFSKNFYSGSKVPIGQVFVLIACVICCILGFMAVTWQMLRVLYHDKPILRVTGTFISVQKTIALGVPLITAIYGGNPNLAFYTLPVLCWHPLQLILGSMIVPSMVKFLAREKERLAAVDRNDNSDLEMDEESAIEVPGTVPPQASGDDGQEEGGGAEQTIAV